MIKLSLNESRTVNFEVYTFDELTPEQKDYVVNGINGLESKFVNLYNMLNNLYSDLSYEYYEEEIDELINKCENSEQGKNYGFIVDKNTKGESTLYWSSNSQGPYPEFKDDVLHMNGFYVSVNKENDFYIDFNLNTSSLDVNAYITLYCEDENNEEYRTGYIADYYTDDSADYDELKNILGNKYSEIDNRISYAQDFIDEFWTKVNNYCQNYMDEDYIRDTLSANDIEFTINDNGTVDYYGGTL